MKTDVRAVDHLRDGISNDGQISNDRINIKINIPVTEPSLLHRLGAVAKKNLSLSKWDSNSFSWCCNGLLRPGNDEAILRSANSFILIPS